MNKKELRALYQQKRTGLSSKALLQQQDLLLIMFQRLTFPYLHFVHSYLPINHQNEVATEPILSYLSFQNPGMQVVIPKTNFDNSELVHYIYNEEVLLKENKYGILEPYAGQEMDDLSSIDMVIVPLLAFDEQGYRVGYGKGFYDRFLAKCKPDVLKVGLSFFEAEDKIDDINQFDIALNFCVTPRSVYEF